jgi:hypothetical protein
MTSMTRFLALATFLLTTAPAVARADVPGGGPDCEMQDGCVFCEEDWENEEDNTCEAEAEADGLIFSCGQRTGAYYCPEGVDATAGCSAVAGGSAPGAAFALSCVAALGLAAARRRKRA